MPVSVSPIDISNLPAKMRRDPKVRALSLKAYHIGENPRRFRVPGTEAIYDVSVIDGAIICGCKAASTGNACAHAYAVLRCLLQSDPRGTYRIAGKAAV